jgi:TonB family protein
VNRINGQAAGGKAARIRWPLVCSAAFHLLAISGLFALEAGPHAGWSRGVVDVLLVGAAGGGRGVENGPVRGSSAGRSSVSAGPAEAGESPPAVPPPTRRPQGSVAGENPRSPEGNASAGAVVPKGRMAPAEDRPDLEGPGLPALLSAPGAQSAARPSGTAVAEGAGAQARGGGTREEGPHPFPEPGEATTSSGRGTTASASPWPTTAALDLGSTAEGPGAGRGMALLRERIRSRIVYPAEAVRRELEGEVLLRIRIERGGNVGEVRVARSSGARILDEAARRGAARAAPLPSDPGWVEVPVRFRLR